ncbi:phage protein NinX family protein [Leclercia sp.]|uniref:phage protein NinX family protein n=1 Tax=Leclercia sp. TaxID=1898428 RepID=UPI00289B0C0F|nr:phage protein NinX family protein [Leclercia sp.]
MDYSKLSDFEINKRVAISRGLKVQEIDDSKATGMTRKYHELKPHTVWVSDGSGPWEQYAPTLCWSDAGPIISDNQINILWNWNEEGVHGATADPLYEYEHENALRSAMIVFLKIQGSANVPVNPTGSDLR